MGLPEDGVDEQPNALDNNMWYSIQKLVRKYWSIKGYKLFTSFQAALLTMFISCRHKSLIVKSFSPQISRHR